MTERNLFEVAAREWMKGCANCDDQSKPWQCEACTEGLANRFTTLMGISRCEVSPYASMMCNRGTKGCIVFHPDSE